MPGIEEISKTIRRHLDRKDAAREDALRISRQIIRECRNAVVCLQKGDTARKNLTRAREMHRQLKRKLTGFPDLMLAGYAVDAAQELAEAEIFAACVCGRDLPSPAGIGVSDESYVLGMADGVGEMRRLFLARLMKGDNEAAAAILAQMEKFFDALMTFDYPDALIATKRKQDVARSLIEKCRSELAMATQISRLVGNLD
jgi:translin